MGEEKIIEAIYTATNGTFVGNNGIRTCMGWLPKYDEQGRILTADPNYIDSTVDIDVTIYKITRKGWYACVWRPEYENAGYTSWWIPEIEKYTIGGGWLDLRPDYVKKYGEE